MTHARSELIEAVKLAANATWVTLRELESSRSIIDADRCRCLVKKASMNLQHTGRGLLAVRMLAFHSDRAQAIDLSVYLLHPILVFSHVFHC